MPTVPVAVGGPFVKAGGALTVMFAVTTLPPKPPFALLTDAWMSKDAGPVLGGVNFSPAFPCENVMKSPALIGVVPLFWKSAPLTMLVILKCVTSLPSATLREITRPEVVCVLTVVVALVTLGVSATGFTVMPSTAAGLIPVPMLSTAA